MLDHQPGVLHQFGKALLGENLHMIGRLVITGRGDALLQVLAHRCRHTQQILRTGTAHAHQFGHERFRLIDMLQHFHAYHFARATGGQRQWQAIADQPQIRLCALRLHLPGQIANLVMFAVGENYRGALPHSEQRRHALAATDVEQGVVSRDREALEQLAAARQKPAVENRVMQPHIPWRDLRAWLRCSRRRSREQACEQTPDHAPEASTDNGLRACARCAKNLRRRSSALA